MQAELPPLRLLPQLFGLLLISELFGLLLSTPGARCCILDVQVFGPRRGGSRRRQGFYRFPVLGAAEAQRCQAAHAAPPYSARGCELRHLCRSASLANVTQLCSWLGPLNSRSYCHGRCCDNAGAAPNRLDKPGKQPEPITARDELYPHPFAGIGYSHAAIQVDSLLAGFQR